MQVTRRPLVTEEQYANLDSFHRHLADHGRFSIINDRDNLREYLRRYYPFHSDSTYRKKQDIGANVFIHQFMLSDDPVFHDHPWDWYISVILKGGYWEHTPWGIFKRTAGDVRRVDCSVWRRLGDDPKAPFLPGNLHWAEVFKPGQTWTLFIRGRTTHDWGFVPNPNDGKWISHLTYLEQMRKDKNEQVGHSVSPACKAGLVME